MPRETSEWDLRKEYQAGVVGCDEVDLLDLFAGIDHRSYFCRVDKI